MRKLLLAGALAIAAVALIVTVAVAHNNGNGHKFVRAHLDGYQEVPAISTAASGKFAAKINGSSIQFKLQYQGLEGPVRFAHIHFAQRGVNGGVVAFLCGGGGKPACPQSGTVEGTITAADVLATDPDQGIAAGEIGELIRAIKSGVTYANVHSDKFPSGEIRGQIWKGGKGHFKRNGNGWGKGHFEGKGKFGDGGKNRGHGGNGHNDD